MKNINIDEIFDEILKLEKAERKISSLRENLYGSSCLEFLKRCKIINFYFSYEEYYNNCLCLRLFINNHQLKYLNCFGKYNVVFVENGNEFEFSFEDDFGYIFFPLDRNNIKNIINFFNLDYKEVIEDFKIISKNFYVIDKVKDELNIVFE